MEFWLGLEVSVGQLIMALPAQFDDRFRASPTRRRLR
jgi:hypothetical protein